MNHNNHKLTAACLLLPGLMAWTAASRADDTAQPVQTLPEVQVQDEAIDPVDSGDLGADGRPEPVSRTNFASPKSKITRALIDTTNAVSTADVLNYAGQGVYARQRYIGDNNAATGMRGSNPYESARVIVNVDGMPIWDPFDASYSAAPRYNLIGPGEVKSLDVIGGPFAAEYSGNAMGGVLNFNTRLPQKREIYTEATYMNQPYDGQGTNADLQGFKTFGSYGDRVGDFSSYFSYNHLENQGQPMTPQYLSNGSANPGSLSAASCAANPACNIGLGGVTTQNPKGNGQNGPSGANMVLYGSDGVYHSSDNLLKWKGGYEFREDLQTMVTVAFDNQDIQHTGVSFLTSPTGQTLYPDSYSVSSSGSVSKQSNSVNGYSLTSSSLGQSQQIRNTLTMAWTLDGRVSGNWFTKTNISYFDILHDTTLTSTFNPADPIAKTAAGVGGQNTSWDNSGWFNLSSKWNNEEFLGFKDLSYAGGYEFQHAAMYQTTYNLANYYGNITAAGSNPNATLTPGKGSNSVTSAADLYPFSLKTGGVTDTQALFSQLSWRFLPDWDATPGVRLERWNMSDGVYITNTSLNGSKSPANRQYSNWSPKFTLGWTPGNWEHRFSVAKAYRYPTDAELFGNSSSVNGSVTLANGTLKPEDGTHYNLYSQYNFESGYLRGEIYHEDIRNAIYSQYIYLGCQNANGTNSSACPLSSMYSSIGQVSTDGADVTSNFVRVAGSPIDVNFNANYVNAIIVSNPSNPSIVGNQMPLMPHWRTNLLTTYHYGSDWDFSVGTRYNSDMKSQLDNKDNGNIYNYTAFTQAYYVDLKATWRFHKGAHLSAGVNNLNDYSPFFNHPLPQRSFFAQIGYMF